MSTISHERPSVGLGTVDVITERFDFCAVLDREGKESLADYCGHRAEEQHMQQHAAVTA